ncbi:MAG: TIGR03564 family F420-dependent LLM class oxidoreductase [Ardenticatenaceae bacterium]|nr:TIGR03564 family F420-dependent LLM class oxidoreductase [Ardenticatenaceae bacterium]
MRIGLVTSPDRVGQISLTDLVEQVVQAEAAGFASFWLVQLPLAGNDVLTAIALAGQKTSQIELGTAVISIYSRHPLTLAQQTLSTQVAVDGRFTLGIGLSHQPVVEYMMGLSYDKPARYMKEYLSVLRPLLAGQKVNFSGENFQVNASLHVNNSTPSPVLLAALAPLMLRLAGETADGTVTWMTGLSTIANHIVPRITAAAVGRPQPRVVASLPLLVTDDVANGREQIGKAYVRYGQLTNYRRMLDLEGAAGPAEVAIVGNEREVESQLRALADAGATDFIASVHYEGDDNTLSQTRTWEFLKSLGGKI